MSWATEEFSTLDLGDQRLNRRATLLVERLATHPCILAAVVINSHHTEAQAA
jgi:hypothetical protein